MITKKYVKVGNLYVKVGNFNTNICKGWQFVCKGWQSLFFKVLIINEIQRFKKGKDFYKTTIRVL
jgi:hypothetical protein